MFRELSAAAEEGMSRGRNTGFMPLSGRQRTAYRQARARARSRHWTRRLAATATAMEAEEARKLTTRRLNGPEGAMGHVTRNGLIGCDGIWPMERNGARPGNQARTRRDGFRMSQLAAHSHTRSISRATERDARRFRIPGRPFASALASCRHRIAHLETHRIS